MQISYYSIFKDAWKITAKNKYLWLFGLFASFISLESVSEVISGQIQEASYFTAFQQKILNLYPDQIANFNHGTNFLTLMSLDFFSYLVFIIVAIIIVLFIWLVFTSQILIIKNTALLFKNKKVIINHAVAESTKKFWPVIGINILSKLFLYAGFIAFSLPLLYSLIIQKEPAIIFTNILFFIIFIVFAVVVNFLTAYSTNYIVLEDAHIFESIKKAWQLFRQNITISLEVSFLLFFLKIITVILTVCLLIIVLLPLFLALFLSFTYNSLLALVVILTLIILGFVIIALLVNAIYATFYLSCWTITFTKLNEETLWGKVVSLINDFPNILKKEAVKYGLKIDKKELKKQATFLAQKTKTEAKNLAQNLEQAYKKYEPQAKKQSKQTAKKLRATYLKLKPIVKKEIKKILIESKKRAKKQVRARNKIKHARS